MKRKILVSTIIALLICVPVFAVTTVYNLLPVSYTVTVDGQPLQSDLPIMNYDGNTYVPMKAVLDMMGAKTIWNGNVNITTPQADPAKAANSVVEIFVGKNGKDVLQGSGVIIGYDKIVTCYHVTEKGDSYRIIYNNGETTNATLLKGNPTTDISVLDPVREDVKPCRIGDSDEVKVGDKIFTISSPQQKINVTANGNVLTYDGYIYSSAVGNFGSSGGAMFSKTGELIGMIKSGDKDSNMVAAIPINDVRKALAN